TNRTANSNSRTHTSSAGGRFGNAGPPMGQRQLFDSSYRNPQSQEIGTIGMLNSPDKNYDKDKLPFNQEASMNSSGLLGGDSLLGEHEVRSPPQRVQSSFGSAFDESSGGQGPGSSVRRKNSKPLLVGVGGVGNKDPTADLFLSPLNNGGGEKHQSGESRNKPSSSSNNPAALSVVDIPGAGITAIGGSSSSSSSTTGGAQEHSAVVG
ncbi:unnamed protein product, partial [Amoebophrya sp. A25]